jgi:hypothetical protein
MAAEEIDKWPPCAEHRERLAFLERAVPALREALHDCTTAVNEFRAELRQHAVDLGLVRTQAKRTATAAALARTLAEGAPQWEDISTVYRASASGQRRAAAERRLKWAATIATVFGAVATIAHVLRSIH